MVSVRSFPIISMRSVGDIALNTGSAKLNVNNVNIVYGIILIIL